MTLQDLLAGLGVPTAVRAGVPDRILPHVVQDSREVQAGDLFVARRGETTDGHVFVRDAVERGAAVVLAERVADLRTPVWVIDTGQGSTAVGLRPAGEQVVAFVLVPDSHKALEQVAAWWRRQLPVHVIGITGSVGKTSTKEMVAAVLSRRYSVLKSERSLNTDVGMALTLLQLGPQHQQAVLEMGMYGKGEIAHLCQLADPSVGVVTNVGPTHLERLGSIDAIAEAKSELIEALPASGVAVLNFDDERVRAMAGKAQAKVVSYGLVQGLDVWASDVESHGLDGIRFRLHHGASSTEVKSQLLGQHSVYIALAAAAAGVALGMTEQDISEGLRQVPDRLRLVVVRGANGATIIDDSYNASPMSTLAALDLLAEMDGRRIAVLGDMLELGTYEEEGHRLVGRRVAEVAQGLVAVGARACVIADEALQRGMAASAIRIASSNAEAVAILRSFSVPGDFVLIKGSRGMRMEEIVGQMR